MSAIIKIIEIDIYCEECGTVINLQGLQKNAFIHAMGVNSWNYLDVYNFPQNWKRYGNECYGTCVLKQQFYCPNHDKPALKRRGRPRKIVA